LFEISTSDRFHPIYLFAVFNDADLEGIGLFKLEVFFYFSGATEENNERPS
jgi:hypothetical protein